MFRSISRRGLIARALARGPNTGPVHQPTTRGHALFRYTSTSSPPSDRQDGDQKQRPPQSWSKRPARSARSGLVSRHNKKVQDYLENRVPTAVLHAETLEVAKKPFTILSGKEKPPQLSKDLRKVLDTPGPDIVHFDAPDGTPRFPEYFRQIRHVDDIDHSRFGDFTTSSRDVKLAQLARHQGATILGSTSSVTTMCVQMHLLMMGDWLPEEQYQRWAKKKRQNGKPQVGFVRNKMSNRLARVLCKPSGAMLRQRPGGVWGVDALPSSDKPQNEVLIKLGRQMESMLTMEPQEFDDKLLIDSVVDPNEPLEGQDAYSYAKIDSTILRSQLDVLGTQLKGRKKVLDLKTRAVLPVRLNPSEYEQYQTYRLETLKGEYHSYEREQNDIFRTILLKYAFQAKIGDMNGILLAYHNTKEVFGFQHMDINYMDSKLFGDTRRGEVAFKLYMQMYDRLLTFVTGRFPDQPALKVLAWAEAVNGPRQLKVFVETASMTAAEANYGDNAKIGIGKDKAELSAEELEIMNERAQFHVDAMTTKQLRAELTARGADATGLRTAMLMRLEGVLTPPQSAESPNLDILLKKVKAGNLHLMTMHVTMNDQHGTVYAKEPLKAWHPSSGMPSVDISIEMGDESAQTTVEQYRKALEHYRCYWAYNNKPDEGGKAGKKSLRGNIPIEYTDRKSVV